MENNTYTGNLYFARSHDILYFKSFRFDEAKSIIEFDFYCDESRWGPYFHEGSALKRGMTHSSYTTERFRPYEKNEAEVQLSFDFETFRFLRDDDGRNFLYVIGMWQQRSKKHMFHGLLKGRE